MGTYDAGLPSSQTKFTSRRLKARVFTTTGTWRKPAGVSAVHAFLVGGGGGGGSVRCTSAGGGTIVAGTGGGGAVIDRDVDVSTIPDGALVPVTIGAGGAGGVNGSAGGVGGDTSFGTLISALGGGGGSGCIDTSVNQGTARATSGGGSSGTAGSRSPNGFIIYGFGGGAGGDAQSGYFYAASGGGGVPPSYPFRPNDLVPFGAGSGAFATYGVTSYAAIQGLPGFGVQGFGKGGQDINGASAAANTGQGGGALGTDSGFTFNSPGGAGGSGYAVISWWE